MTVTVTDKRGTGTRKSAPLVDGKQPPPWWPVFIAIEAERKRQLEKWGNQNGKRLDGTGHALYVYNAAEYQRQNDARAEAGRKAVWAKVLLEETFEALAETDPAALREELVQVAAVATAWIEDIDSRTTA